MALKSTFRIVFFFLLLTACNNDTSPNQDNDGETNGESETYEIITIESDWFDVSYLDPKIYIINESQSSQGNVSYLLLGDNDAIMFDTGSGENTTVNGFKIKYIVDQLTPLPTTLLLSHFHFDHNQNISEFNSITFPDLQFLRESVTAGDLYNFTAEDLFFGDYPSQAQVNAWMPVNTDIDLGNRIIQLVNIPGHTSESVAIIDKTNKFALLGDYLYNGTLFLFDNNDVTLYKESVDYLLTTLDSGYRLFGAHGAPEIAYSKLQTLQNFLQCIIDDTCQGTATSVWGYNVLVYEYESMSLLIFQ